MKILAIDTSTNVASTAVLTEEKLVYENIIDDKLNHSQNLLPILNSMLEKIELTYRDFDYYAVTVGPGSFTGLRIGLSTVKGLSQVTDVPVIPATSLEILAYNLLYVTGIVIPVLDARQNRYYSAAFDLDGSGKIKKVLAEADLSAEDLSQRLKDIDITTGYLLGDGAEKYLSEEHSGLNLIPVVPSLKTNKAASLAQYAILHTDQAVDFHELMPLYLRGTYARKKS